MSHSESDTFDLETAKRDGSPRLKAKFISMSGGNDARVRLALELIATRPEIDDFFNTITGVIDIVAEDHDSLKYPFMPPSAMGLPLTTQTVHDGSCVAHAATYFLVHKLFKATGQYLPLGPRSLYAAARRVGGFDKSKRGSTLEAVAIALTSKGIALEDLFPAYNLPEVEFGDYDLMSQEARDDALTRAIKGTYFFTGERPSFDELKRIIRRYGGVILAIEVQVDELWNHDAHMTWENADKGQVAKHAVYVPAFAGGKLLFPNCWGTEWGHAGGWGSLGEDYVPHIIDGLVFTGGVTEINA